MRRALLLVFALSGCDIVFRIDAIETGSGSDIDAAVPPAEGIAPACSLVGQYGPQNKGLVRYCVRTDLGALELGGTFNTTANPMCDYVASNGADLNVVCVVSASSISVTSPLVVTGDKPLVLAALSTITVTAPIDLTGGPGANPPTCSGSGKGANGSPNSSGSAGGGGGGGGGGWQTVGGKGGMGKVGVTATGGSVSMTVADIRGGCPGGGGGSGQTGIGGAGGSGGGALYLTARMAIHVSSTGSINASGRGGQGGIGGDGGAGGGGSGGLIAFDSPTITFDIVSQPGAKVFANGGGGGAGGNASVGTISTAPATAAIGGSPNGGIGAVLNGPGAAGGTGTTTGGGGGGGGQGFFVLYTVSGPITDDPMHFSPTMIYGT